MIDLKEAEKQLVLAADPSDEYGRPEWKERLLDAALKYAAALRSSVHLALFKTMLTVAEKNFKEHTNDIGGVEIMIDGAGSSYACFYFKDGVLKYVNVLP